MGPIRSSILDIIFPLSLLITVGASHARTNLVEISGTWKFNKFCWSYSCRFFSCMICCSRVISSNWDVCSSNRWLIKSMRGERNDWTIGRMEKLSNAETKKFWTAFRKAFIAVAHYESCSTWKERVISSSNAASPSLPPFSLSLLFIVRCEWIPGSRSWFVHSFPTEAISATGMLQLPSPPRM